MSKSHATGWENDPAWQKERVTPAQLKEFYDQVHSLRITRYSLQAFLNATQPAHGKSISETKIQPGMAIVYEVKLDLLTLRPPEGGKMYWRNRDNKRIAGFRSEHQFWEVSRLIAETHGLEIEAFDPYPHLPGEYRGYRFILPKERD